MARAGVLWFLSVLTAILPGLISTAPLARKLCLSSTQRRPTYGGINILAAMRLYHSCLA